MLEYLEVLFVGSQEENDEFVKFLKEHFDGKILEIEYQKRDK